MSEVVEVSLMRFVPITPDEYTAIEAQLAAGTYSYGIFVEGE